MTSQPATGPDQGPRAGEGALTAAEFRIARQRLGLTAETLAERLGVALRTVRRWEHGHSPVPDGIGAELDALEEQAKQQATAIVARLDQAGHHVLFIPEDDSSWPAGWWLMLAARVRDLRPDVRIRYHR